MFLVPFPGPIISGLASGASTGTAAGVTKASSETLPSQHKMA